MPRWLILLLLIAACSAPPALPAGVPGGAQPAVVTRNVDGDTIWVRVKQPGPIPAGEHKVRLLEIDTPEIAGEAGPDCYGREAAAFAQRLLPVGERVALVGDREDLDRYDRYLRYVWTEDGTFFNAEAVRQGFARAVLYEPNDRYIAQLRELESEARGHGRGMWSACPVGR